ncbi:TNF receptor-associated factor 3-like, partial [Rhipicephalus sanguineus]|uniref:TNF receptor-associated factor 3-like n=1 Tax=Rhipicephalus sanguineus TaxID=34632 RepID=UPI0020C425C5
MPDLRRVHRFCDHPIAGVNWRPTRFVDEVPTPGVCGLCHMIPKRIVLLPCLHTLCESCQAAISQGTGGWCALDQEPYEEAECVGYDFPTRKVNALKVYCWNHTQGCEYEGAMKDMLRHFENECTFHSVECIRCGEAVLHRELATHYVAGCSVGVSSAHIENRSLESRALTLQDVKNALEEVKILLRDANHDHVLPVIQSHLNELTEQVRNQESRLAQITREAGASVNAETAQHGKARGVSKAMG